MKYEWQPKPTILSRTEWKADSPSGCSGSNSKKQIIVHHSGDENDAISKAFGNDEKGFMKRIQEIHIGQGWCDIGYNYGIGVNGTILDGRNDNVTGSHATGYNSSSIGVFIHGNYDIRTFKSIQENSLVTLLSWLCYNYNISSANIIGHRDVSNKSCPGSNIYSRLNLIKDRVTQNLYPDILPE